MATNCTIPADPEIAGIGVRVSFYIQAALGALPSIVSLWNAWVLPEVVPLTEGAVYLKSVKKASRGLANSTTTLLLTGCALLTSAFIQGSLYGLTVYHTLILLNLSWLNNLTAVVCLVSFIFLPTPLEAVDDNLIRHTLALSLAQAVAFIVHCSATGALGLWLFATVDTYGLDPGCNSSTVFYVFGSRVSATSSELRAFSLFVYSIAAPPLLNCAAYIFIMWIPGEIVIFLVKRWIAQRQLQALILRTSYIFMVVLLDILLIVSTEGMIAMNRPFVSDGEGDWTFGQTLALFSLVIPIMPLCTAVGKKLGTVATRILSFRPYKRILKPVLVTY